MLAEQPPREASAAHVAPGELSAPRAIVEALVEPEQQRVERAAERKRVAVVVRRLEAPIDAEIQLSTTVAARTEQLTVELRVGEAHARHRSHTVALSELLPHVEPRREPLDTVVSRQVEAIMERWLLRRPPGLQREA